MAIYLKISNVKGNITVAQFKDAIEIFDLEFSGFSKNFRMRIGDTIDRNTGSLLVGQITFLKAQDNSTTDFFQAAHNGLVFKTVEFNYITEGKEPTIYGKLILNNAIVTSFSEKHSQTLHRPIERISLAYTQIQKNIIPIDSSGKAGSQSTTGYDLEKAQAM